MTPRADRLTAGHQLVLIAVVQVLAMSSWFSASAVVPSLRTEWAISTQQGTLLTVAVQLGFVVGAVLSAVLSLPDRWPPHRLAAGSALVAAVSTGIIALAVDSLAPALPLRFLTGVALAGVYPTGIKLMASWFQRGRGLAIGVLVGALTLGSSLPQLLNGLAGAFGDLPWRSVLLTSSVLCLVAAAIAMAFVRLGPLAAPAPPFDPSYLLRLFRDRGPRLANLGYFGHMWELYAMWTWLPAYLAASFAVSDTWAGSRTAIGLVAFAVIGLAGVVGALAGGWLGDRFGRARVAGGAMAISASCCLLAAATYGASPYLLLPVLALWGISIIADSGLFSTLMTEVADRRYIGTALTMQTAIGFLLTVVTINAVPYVVDWIGWRGAVALLAIGPIAGTVAMVRLDALLTVRRGPAGGPTAGRC
ncbi:MAG: MFS transporter [Nocardioides sp.]